MRDVLMKRFVFPLDSVRRLRIQQEQVAQTELARVMRERAAVLEQIDESRRAEQDLYEYLRAPGRSAAELAHVARYGSWHRHQLYTLGVRLRQFDKGVELAQDRVREAHGRREALDRLHERQHAAWERGMRLQEQAELDEIATMRAAARPSMVGGVA